MNKARWTIFDRSTPKGRAMLRKRALTVHCRYCEAPEGKPCRGMIGKPAKPHAIRIADSAPE